MLTTLLIGGVLGGLLVVGVIFSTCVVETKEKRHEHNQVATAVRYRVYALEAENAQLRIALAAGQMTEEGKKIATMTMAALDAVIAAAAKEVMQESAPSPVTSQEPACTLEDKQ